MRAITILCLILMISCTKDEFYLDFNLSESVTDNYNVTYYSSDKTGGSTVQAVASVMKGKCELTCLTNTECLVYITPKKSYYPLVIYADRGNKISLTGESVNPLEWSVEGNEINATLTQWRLKNDSVLNQKNPDIVNDAIAGYLEMNKADDAGFIILLSYFNRSRDELMFDSLLSKFDRLENKKSLLEIIARSDLLELPVTNYNITEMTFRTKITGADTIKFGGSVPGFLFFWQNDMKQKKELMDSLATLSKEFPDSTQRLIADINLDNDSTVWRSGIRRDSLKNIARLWAPAGFADEGLMNLKVGRIPYFIVYDTLGEQKYRGIEVDSAMKVFRRLLNPQDSIAE